MFAMQRRIAPFFALLLLLAFATVGVAQDAGPIVGGASGPMDMMSDLIQPIILSVVFTVIGLILFGICLLLVVKLAPFSVRKEIEEDQNIALGIIVGSMILGIAIILAAAMLG